MLCLRRERGQVNQRTFLKSLNVIFGRGQINMRVGISRVVTVTKYGNVGASVRPAHYSTHEMSLQLQATLP